jgi:predicted Zn-dependent protease
MSEPPVANLFGQAGALNRLEDLLKLAPLKNGQVELVLEREQVAVTRFAHNRIHQNVSNRDTRLWVRAVTGGSVASIACNSLDKETVRAAIEQAFKIARLMPDRRHPGFAANSNESGHNVEPGSEGLTFPGQTNPIQPAPAFFAATANQTPEERAMTIEELLGPVREAGLEGYGTYKNSLTELAVANSQGLRSFAAGTFAYLKGLVETADGHQAGFADQLSRDVTTFDPLALARTAIWKCRLNKNQLELAPGEYAAVLEPNTVADLVRFMVIHGCGATQLQDGRSFMTGRFGEVVTGENINLWEDPASPYALPFPIDYEGLEARAVPLVSNGRAAGVVYDRATAARIPGRVSTGQATNPWDNQGENDPLPQHIVMAGGTKSSEELVRGMKRGLVITRLHYTHCPDPRRVVATGTTRDGTFLVENGEIVGAVKNMRLTQSVLELLNTVEEFGQPKTCQDWWTANGMGITSYYLPALRVARCAFTGITTF